MYREILKINMHNFMHCLFLILINTGKSGEIFLEHFYIYPKMEYFKKDYFFNKNGTYKESNRKITDATRKEYERFKRISFESIYDYQKKDNRNLKINPSLFFKIENNLHNLYIEINNNPTNYKNKLLFENIIYQLEKSLI